MQGSLVEIIRVSITSLFGIYLLAGGLEGYMWKQLNFLQRALLIAGALLLVDGGLVTDLIGLGIGAAMIVIQKPWEKKKPAVTEQVQ